MPEALRDGLGSRRPFSVTLVLLGVILIGLANGWRALGLLRQSSLLLEAGAEPDPRLCAVGSVAWALLFLGLAFALWRRKSYTRLIVPAALLGYGLFLFILPGPCPVAARLQEKVTVEGIIYAAAVLYATLVLNIASGRAYFRPGTRRPRGSKS